MNTGGIFSTLDSQQIPFQSSVSVEEEFVENETEIIRYRQLNMAMDTLSPRQREAIYLKFISELSYNEIGLIMKLNYQSARNLVFRALEKLRESLPSNLFIFFLRQER